MKCPNCIAVDLLMSERKGIEIDYCPSCRGVWLDRGELDKFIQQAELQKQLPSAQIPSAPTAYVDSPPPRYEGHDDDGYKYKDRGYESRENHDRNGQYHRHGKKKESFWSELFDFD